MKNIVAHIEKINVTYQGFLNDLTQVGNTDKYYSSIMGCLVSKDEVSEVKNALKNSLNYKKEYSIYGWYPKY